MYDEIPGLLNRTRNFPPVAIWVAQQEGYGVAALADFTEVGYTHTLARFL
jgi:hypothetical protein